MSIYNQVGVDNPHLIAMMRMGGMPAMGIPQRPMYASPAESFISDISDISAASFNDMPLFGDGTISPSDTSLTTPDINDDDGKDYVGSNYDHFATEKKPVKKRKSWGQELPQPTTNLPPRKRAKTAAEKEQRRIERVLRNRAAAQSSRERKRQEVEALEDHKKLVETDNVTLQRELNAAKSEISLQQRKIVRLMTEVNSLRRVIASSGLPTPETQPASFENSPHPSPHPSITTTKQEVLTPEVHPSSEQLGYAVQASPQNHLNPTMMLNHPHCEEADDFEEMPSKSNSGMTQHPAVVLCDDLPCQPEFETPASLPVRSPLLQTVFDQAQLLSDDLLSRASNLLGPLLPSGKSKQMTSPRPPPLQQPTGCTMEAMGMTLLSPLRTPPFSMSW